MTHVERRQARPGRETIHSGHFMVSHFEAEAQDDFDDLAVPVPDEEQNSQKVTVVSTYTVAGAPAPLTRTDIVVENQHQQLSIETSLTKLFRCMTLAYRQKLTSPKWNRFKGIKLRWKDKIRLNNVIWRCWHMQFIKKQNTLVCQFASPLDVDTHVKPETTILEGKYWKRRAEAVIAEYKKWRMFHIMRLLGKGDTSVQDSISEMDTVESLSQCSELAGAMLTDEDYLSFMSDTLFSTITSHQPFAFPDPREIARGASLADFIQPSLGPLQPNLEDFMDTLEPLHDLLLTPRLPPVPEESAVPSEEPLYRGALCSSSGDAYSSHSYIPSHSNAPPTMPTSQMSIHGTNSNTQMMSSMPEQTVKNEHHMQMYDGGRLFSQTDLQNNMMSQETPASYSQNVQNVQNVHSNEQVQGNIYSGKSSRLQYGSAPPKIVTQDTTSSYKYNQTIPPSQTAPETVSLLQQPIPNAKYASTIVIQGRSGYDRNKPRPRISHYSPQQVSTQQYQGYQNIPAHGSQSMSYETRPAAAARQASPQMQYLQPSHAEPYKGKSVQSPVNNRSFKMPSPPLVPLAPATHQQIQVQQSSSSHASISQPSKESYRSNSLPIGAQLNADWSISNAQVADSARQTARGRESASGGALRLRSRSSSSGGAETGPGGAGGAGGARRPPPLHSVASEPALPHASVMLAQLLSKQHSASVYRMGSSEEGARGDPASPARRAEPAPAAAAALVAAAALEPHQFGSVSPCGSPPPSPGGGESPVSRRTHMHAEQKRRYNIKHGFDTLQALIPHLNNNPAAKISKAAMLQKGAEYIKQLKAERNQIKEEMESLRQQIDCLNNSIANCHSLLPATGAPVSGRRCGRLREMFARHVSARAALDWRYWLFSMLCAALLDSYSASVAAASPHELARSTLLWAEQHCSLVELRPAVLNSLRLLCTSTDILTNPERLPEEARAAAAAAAVAAAPAPVKSEPPT